MHAISKEQLKALAMQVQYYAQQLAIALEESILQEESTDDDASFLRSMGIEEGDNA